MTAADCATLALPESYRAVQARALRRGESLTVSDCVATEVPVAFEFNGISHAVMMATPADLEDFALGFALSEGIVDSAAEVHDIEVSTGPLGHTLHIDIASSCFNRLKTLRRNLTGRTGCGLCGTESLAQAVRTPPQLQASARFRAATITQAMAALRPRQALLAQTGATHAAAWCNTRGDIALLREDVGRHNALDKLIGACVRERLPLASGFIAITSRASYEMVQKTAVAGVGCLVAVSGVTSLALDVAEQTGLTLLGFARGNDLTVYTHPARLEWT